MRPSRPKAISPGRSPRRRGACAPRDARSGEAGEFSPLKRVCLTAKAACSPMASRRCWRLARGRNGGDGSMAGKTRFHPFNLKRVYAPAEESDGFRVLVDRLWPRGVAKDKVRIDLWL